MEEKRSTVEYEEVMSRLSEFSDADYAAFSRRTNPTARGFIGVRVPNIRKVAKEYYGRDFSDFYEKAKDGTWEEQMLCALFIASKKTPYDSKIRYLDDFVPRIIDWAVNDTLTMEMKLKKDEYEDFFSYIDKFLSSDREFEQRFGVVILMSSYLNETYGKRVMQKIDRVGQEEYYSKMAVAWLLATAMADGKIPNIAEAYLYGRNRLPYETLRMTVRKCYDSYRVSRERYARLKAFYEGERLADLHIHTCVSDGTFSPAEVVNKAKKKGVEVLAVCDHDFLSGSLEAFSLAKEEGLVCLPGVEINSLYKGRDTHILGYNVDYADEEFAEFVQNVRDLLVDISRILLERMQKDYPGISLEEWRNYSYDRKKGGWMTLYYLIDKGIARDVKEAMSFYAKYNCGYDIVPFPSPKEVIDRIHKAGGKAVLAHPGVTLRGLSREEFTKEFEELMTFPFDGVECYYMAHSGFVKHTCLDYCEARGLMITSGSDCHGKFGKPDIGDPGTRVRQIRLSF